MEKKKLLLVAISVGVVLLIIISIPLIVFSPRQSPAPSWHTETPDAPDNQYAAPTVQPELAQPSYSITEQEVYVSEVHEAAVVEAPNVTTLTIPTPRTAAVPDAPARTAAKPAVAAKPAAAPAPAKPAPAQPAKEAAKPKAAAKPAQAEPAKTTFNNYWVQTGAFSTKIRAEGAKEALEGKGITSVIDNRDIEGKTWYRVRVGPYMSETEAGYWLGLVKSIEGFGESQIRQAQSY
jgi:DedD protein